MHPFPSEHAFAPAAAHAFVAGLQRFPHTSSEQVMGVGTQAPGQAVVIALKVQLGTDVQPQVGPQGWVGAVQVPVAGLQSYCVQTRGFAGKHPPCATGLVLLSVTTHPEVGLAAGQVTDLHKSVGEKGAPFFGEKSEIRILFSFLYFPFTRLTDWAFANATQAQSLAFSLTQVSTRAHACGLVYVLSGQQQ